MKACTPGGWEGAWPRQSSFFRQAAGARASTVCSGSRVASLNRSLSARTRLKRAVRHRRGMRGARSGGTGITRSEAKSQFASALRAQNLAYPLDWPLPAFLWPWAAW